MESFKKLRKNAGIRSVAEAYLQHYLQGEIHTLKYLTAEDMQYDAPNLCILMEDPRKETKITGREEVLQNFETYFDRVKVISYEVKNQFIARESVYFEVQLRFTQSGRHLAGASDPESVYHFMLPMNILLRVQKSRIICHQDYADWSVIYRQLHAQVHEAS